MFKLNPLPYKSDALEPYISSKTVSFHYEKHHAGYVTKMNALIKDMGRSFDSLEDVIAESISSDSVLFNNAAQVWNHDFFWQSMVPSGGGKPTSEKMGKIIDWSFGSYDNFKAKFSEVSMAQFGSGWAWLLFDRRTSKLRIESTSNANHSWVDADPILTCDLWEHAYYLDYQNKRLDFVNTFIDHLINWEFAEKNLHAAEIKLS